MRKIETVQDIYAALDELIPELRRDGQEKLANIIHHRMHTVAWTSGSELMRELQTVLTKALESNFNRSESETKKQLEAILTAIKG